MSCGRGLSRKSSNIFFLDELNMLKNISTLVCILPFTQRVSFADVASSWNLNFVWSTCQFFHRSQIADMLHMSFFFLLLEVGLLPIWF